MAKRPKPKVVSSAGEIGQLQYNEAAYGQRNVQVGGVWEIIGTAATAKRVGYFAALRCVNNSGTAAYVAIGDSSVAAPTGLSDGHWIAPNSELFISTGDTGEFVRASTATIGIYKMDDNVVIADDDRAGR